MGKNEGVSIFGEDNTTEIMDDGKESERKGPFLKISPGEFTLRFLPGMEKYSDGGPKDRLPYHTDWIHWIGGSRVRCARRLLSPRNYYKTKDLGPGTLYEIIEGKGEEPERGTCSICDQTISWMKENSGIKGGAAWKAVRSLCDKRRVIFRVIDRKPKDGSEPTIKLLDVPAPPNDSFSFLKPFRDLVEQMSQLGQDPITHLTKGRDVKLTVTANGEYGYDYKLSVLRPGPAFASKEDAAKLLADVPNPREWIVLTPVADVEAKLSTAWRAIDFGGAVAVTQPTQTARPSNGNGGDHYVEDSGNSLDPDSVLGGVSNETATASSEKDTKEAAMLKRLKEKAKERGITV